MKLQSLADHSMNKILSTYHYHFWRIVISFYAAWFQFMNDYPDIRIELGSHTDCRGNNAFNQRLSEARARNSAAYIKERITNPDRVTGRGYGEERPVTDCDCVRGKKKPCTKEEHQMNRRTEFTIVNR